nr:hypothetical protein Iba_chr01dCG15350 [Ipomoea batatas]
MDIHDLEMHCSSLSLDAEEDGGLDAPVQDVASVCVPSTPAIPTGNLEHAENASTLQGENKRRRNDGKAAMGIRLGNPHKMVPWGMNTISPLTNHPFPENNSTLKPRIFKSSVVFFSSLSRQDITSSYHAPLDFKTRTARGKEGFDWPPETAAVSTESIKPQRLGLDFQGFQLDSASSSSSEHPKGFAGVALSRGHADPSSNYKPLKAAFEATEEHPVQEYHLQNCRAASFDHPIDQKQEISFGRIQQQRRDFQSVRDFEPTQLDLSL